MLPNVQESRGVMQYSRGTVVQSPKAVLVDTEPNLKAINDVLSSKSFGPLISSLSKLHLSRSNYTMIANLS